MKGLDTEPYKGVRDFYPEDWARLSAVFSCIRDVLSRWGYQEYQASPLERSELYESKGNEEIIREQTYTFEDRGGRRVTLRPEMTPTLARMVAHKRREMAFPLRWFSIGNRFRYERMQRGRLREFYQTDVDFIGPAAGEADLEVIQIAYAILKAFGATDSDFVIRLNSRTLLAAATKASGISDEEGLREFWRLLDKKSKMSAEEFEAARGGKNDPLRVIEDESDETVREEKAKVLSMVEELKARGVANVVFDPEIVRGFDYYTGMVFEVNDTHEDNRRALFGGGRYDGLVAMFGGDPIPAVGFAFGDVTLMDFLETHGILPNAHDLPQVYIGTPDPAYVAKAQAFANTLRTENTRVFVNVGTKGLGDQIKDAHKRGIPYFIAYGENEVKKGKVKVKELATGKEKELPLRKVAQFFSNR